MSSTENDKCPEVVTVALLIAFATSVEDIAVFSTAFFIDTDFFTLIVRTASGTDSMKFVGDEVLAERTGEEDEGKGRTG